MIEKTHNSETNQQDQQDAIESFRNECGVLEYLRNYSCQYVASYYLEEVKRGQEIHRIYVDFYPRSLAEVAEMDGANGKFRSVLGVLRMLARAVLFLSENRLLHRDLKPSNIMVEHNNTIKLIDFGSAWVHSLETNKLSTKCMLLVIE